MTDEQILREIEKYLRKWFEMSGWAEENSGCRDVLNMIDDLRAGRLKEIGER